MFFKVKTIVSCLATLVLAALLNRCICEGVKTKKAMCFKEVSLFDGYTYYEEVNLLVVDGIVDSIVQNGWVPENIEVFESSGKTIIPPLINAHVHVGSSQNLKTALSNGIFVLMDMHTTDELASTMRRLRDSLTYAYYYSSGPGLTVAGGHGTEYGVPVPTIDEKTSSAKFVRDRIEKGADYIKIFLEPSMNSITLDDAVEAINESRTFNRTSIAHISRLIDALNLSNKGVDGLGHFWIDSLASKETISEMSKNGTFIISTLHGIKIALDQLSVSYPNKKFPSFQEIRDQVAVANSVGICILAGTDSPNFEFDYGPELFTEMELLASCGLTNIEVLKTATTNIYTSFHLKEYTSIRPGEIANFILVEGNPVKNISDLRNTKTVVKKGVVLKGI